MECPTSSHNKLDWILNNRYHGVGPVYRHLDELETAWKSITRVYFDFDHFLPQDQGRVVFRMNIHSALDIDPFCQPLQMRYSVIRQLCKVTGKGELCQGKWQDDPTEKYFQAMRRGESPAEDRWVAIVGGMQEAFGRPIFDVQVSGEWKRTRVLDLDIDRWSSTISFDWRDMFTNRFGKLESQGDPAGRKRGPSKGKHRFLCFHV